jgi:hypothetical protein
VTHIRSIIYGTREHLEAFITAETVMAHDHIMDEFKPWLKRYVLELTAEFGNPIQKPQLEVIELDHDFDTAWLNTDPLRQRWRLLLRHAAEMGLEWEFIRVGNSYNDHEELRTSGAKRFIRLGPPAINNDMQIEMERKLDTFGE